jgi:hypothetical protein
MPVKKNLFLFFPSKLNGQPELKFDTDLDELLFLDRYTFRLVSC